MAETTMIVYDDYNKHTITITPSKVNNIIIKWVVTSTYRSIDSERIITTLNVDAALTLAGMLKTAADIARSK